MKLKGILINSRVVFPWAENRQCSFSNKGFTLIEILVAMSVLAVCLVVILQLFSGGLKSGRLSDAYTRAIFYAREKMEEILLSESLEEGVKEGDFDDDYRWRSEMVREPRTEDEAEKLPLEAFEITVTVTWDQNTTGKVKSFQLSTVKVVEKTEDTKAVN